MEVKIPVPEGIVGSDLKVYRKETDGTYTDMKAVYSDGYMIFTTDHFSEYILSTEPLNNDDDGESTSSTTENPAPVVSEDNENSALIPNQPVNTDTETDNSDNNNEENTSSITENSASTSNQPVNTDTETDNSNNNEEENTSLTTENFVSTSNQPVNTDTETNNSNNNGEKTDNNVNTGLAVCIVPALIAATGVVIAKKRK